MKYEFPWGALRIHTVIFHLLSPGTHFWFSGTNSPSSVYDLTVIKEF